MNMASVKKVVFNADDFGLSDRTNRAIVRAHAEGVLTSASLMVAEPAAEAAIALATQHPALAVGLHVAVSCGCPVLPAREIPHLVGSEGRFRPDPALAGMIYYFSRAARREVSREIAAQFARFAETGLPWDHVNGHQHLHMHPVVWDCVVRECEAHGVRRVRIPYEEFVPPARAGGGSRVEWLFFRALRRRCLRSLAGRGFTVPDRVYGHLGTGRMSAAYVLELLGRLGGEANEIYLHPGTPHAAPLPGGAPEMDVELDALLSPRVPERLSQLGILRVSYRQIG